MRMDLTTGAVPWRSGSPFLLSDDVEVEDRMSESHVRAAIDGDRDAFGRLVHHHASAVWAVATAIAGDPEIGRDVAQEAFVAAWQGLHRLRDPGRFGPWLLEIARNRARDAARRGRRRPAQALHTEPADPSPDVADRLDASVREATVWRALDDLTESDREVLLLVYQEGCSVRDVARSLGLTEVAVRKRLSRARARLRDGVEARLGATVSSAAPSPRSVATGVGAVLSGLTARRAWAAPWPLAAAGGVALVGIVGITGIAGMSQVDRTLDDVPVAMHPVERCTPTEACVATVVEHTALPDHVVHAFLAAEDVRFFEHGGVDAWAAARAAWHNATGKAPGCRGGARSRSSSPST